MGLTKIELIQENLGLRKQINLMVTVVNELKRKVSEYEKQLSVKVLPTSKVDCYRKSSRVLPVSSPDSGASK